MKRVLSQIEIERKSAGRLKLAAKIDVYKVIFQRLAVFCFAYKRGAKDAALLRWSYTKAAGARSACCYSASPSAGVPARASLKRGKLLDSLVNGARLPDEKRIPVGRRLFFIAAQRKTTDRKGRTLAVKAATARMTIKIVAVSFQLIFRAANAAACKKDDDFDFLSSL